MSVVISSDIFCDGEGCLEWTKGVVGQCNMAAGARLVAKRKGWHITPDRDLCPACRAHLKLKEPTP